MPCLAMSRCVPRLAKARGLPLLDGGAGKEEAAVYARRLRKTEFRIIPPTSQRAASYAEFGRQSRRGNENFAALHRENGGGGGAGKQIVMRGCHVVPRYVEVTLRDMELHGHKALKTID